MRSMMFLIAVLLAPLTLAGCFLKLTPIEVTTALTFCDAYALRRFTQQQVDWRAKNDTVNFRKDLTNNKDHDEECPDEDEENPAD